LKQGNSMRKKRAEEKCYELTTTPIPHSPEPLGEEGRRKMKNEGMKLSLGRSGEQGEGTFSFAFVSSYPTLLLIRNK